MNNVRIFALMLLTIMLGGAACPPGPSPVPSAGGSAGTGGSVVVVEAGTGGGGSGGSLPVPVGADDCDRADDFATKMGCPLKRPKRATWAEACRNGRANGVDMQDDCVLKATDCAGIHSCVSQSAP